MVFLYEYWLLYNFFFYNKTISLFSYITDKGVILCIVLNAAIKQMAESFVRNADRRSWSIRPAAGSSNWSRRKTSGKAVRFFVLAVLKRPYQECKTTGGEQLISAVITMVLFSLLTL